jgi:uncharacterized membrane protein YgdD (TMEM256/DUF423 family)
MKARNWIVIAGLLGGSGVALGAFEAHGLESAIGEWISDPALVEKRMGDWEVAVRYQMYHALAMLGVGLMAVRGRRLLLDLAGWCFLIGPGLFSGGLYLLVLSHAWSEAGWRWLGMIVPIGGLLMIVGWVLLVSGAWSIGDDAPHAS